MFPDLSFFRSMLFDEISIGRIEGAEKDVALKDMRSLVNSRKKTDDLTKEGKGILDNETLDKLLKGCSVNKLLYLEYALKILGSGDKKNKLLKKVRRVFDKKLKTEHPNEVKDKINQMRGIYQLQADDHNNYIYLKRSEDMFSTSHFKDFFWKALTTVKPEQQSEFQRFVLEESAFQRSIFEQYQDRFDLDSNYKQFFSHMRTSRDALYWIRLLGYAYYDYITLAILKGELERKFLVTLKNKLKKKHRHH